MYRLLACCSCKEGFFGDASQVNPPGCEGIECPPGTILENTPGKPGNPEEDCLFALRKLDGDPAESELKQ